MTPVTQRAKKGPRYAARPSESCLEKLLVGALQVLAGAGVYFDLIAFVDEERDGYREARLELGRLGRALRRVAFDAGLGLNHAEDDGGRKLHADRFVAVGQDGAVVILTQEGGS